MQFCTYCHSFKKSSSLKTIVKKLIFYTFELICTKTYDLICAIYYRYLCKDNLNAFTADCSRYINIEFLTFYLVNDMPRKMELFRHDGN
jgi:hypothetical protein